MAKKQNPNHKPKKQKVEWRRVLFGGLAAVLALLLLLPMVTMILGGAGAVTQSEIDALKAEQAASQARQDELEEQLADVEADQAEAQQRRQLLQAQLDAINNEIENIDKQIAYSSRPRPRPTSRPSMSCSASGCAPWRRRGRCPTGPSSSTRRAFPRCWTVWPTSTR